MNNIEIYYDNQQFESDYLPLISFKTKEQQIKAEEYIVNKVDNFFKKIIKLKIDVVQSHQIPYSKIITEKDFSNKKKKIVQYFYDNIFYDLGKRDPRNKLQFTPKWGITFDEKCAPIIINGLSPAFRIYPYTDMNKIIWENIDKHYRYGIISLNKEPIFYYIYFTLQELLDVIKE